MANKNHPKSATIDFVMNDNGSATATLSFVDAAGLPTTLPAGASITTPPWNSSDPSVVATAAADGMTAQLAPSVPPVLATGVSISTAPVVMTAADGTTSTLTGAVAQPIDVIAGGPAGFAIALNSNA